MKDRRVGACSVYGWSEQFAQGFGLTLRKEDDTT
jgi:hypothetical protein